MVMLSKADQRKLQAITDNKRVQYSTYIAFIITYLAIILVGFVGNAYIILACLRNKLLKTTRNILIANIAVADILLCLFTMPLSMLDMIHNYWPLGSGQEILCQLGSSSQSVCVFFCSFSVVLITIDRYLFIVYPNMSQMKTNTAFSVSILGFLASVMFSSPLFVYTKIKTIFVDASYCYEDFPPYISRLAYVYSSLIVQYIIPSIIVIIAYSSIYKVLKTSTAKVIVKTSRHKMYRKLNRRKRTNIILTVISCVFFISWAPLNILNVLINTSNPFETEEAIVTSYGICHIIGMSSALTNPLLYGLLNTNFRKAALPRRRARNRNHIPLSETCL